MFVTTFYSFKGGVGRSMALANCALELARRGRRVLVADFDLEAPGVQTFPAFAVPSQQRGLVDFVLDYQATGKAPDVRGYVLDSPKNENIVIMPAGRRGDGYGGRLGAIDWQQLYEHELGFLLFEDMRQQWAQFLRPDYVLIDSRTGHNETAGICTRQLPDAVVMVFVPSRENIEGLEQVAGDIRSQGAATGPRNPSLLFVPSRIPVIDDEEGQLAEALTNARHSLGYDESAAVIHHYDSLALLQQSLFIVDRPTSRLSREYQSLVDSIVRENLQDKAGALMRLESLGLRSSVRHSLFAAGLSDDVRETIQSVADLHGGDAEVLARAAEIFLASGATEDAFALLTKAQALPNRPSHVVRLLAEASQKLGLAEEAKVHFVSVISSHDAEVADLLSAVRALRTLSPESLTVLSSSPAMQRLQTERQVPIAGEALLTEELARELAKHFGKIVNEVGKADSVLNQAALVMIAARKFDDARRVLGGEQPFDMNSVSVVFNWAMADWGFSRKPNRQVFATALQLGRGDTRSGSNFFQCMAIASIVAEGGREVDVWIERARAALARTPILVFSAWRYLDVKPDVFLEDLELLRRYARGAGPGPLILDAS